MAKSKYLTKRQKKYRISRTHTKLSQKSIQKLLRIRKAETFTRKLKQVVGGVKGATRKKIYSQPTILNRIETQIRSQLKENPHDKKLQRALLSVVIRRDRLMEKNATPQEREEMEFRHRRKEAEMISAISHGEKIKQSETPMLPKELIETELLSEFRQWRETTDAENYRDIEKEIASQDKDKTAAEIQDEAQQKFEPMSDDEAYELFWKEQVLHDEKVEISERNGMYLYKVGDDYLVFYQEQKF